MPFDGCWLLFVIIVVRCFVLAFGFGYVFVAVSCFLSLFCFVVCRCVVFVVRFPCGCGGWSSCC